MTPGPAGLFGEAPAAPAFPGATSSGRSSSASSSSKIRSALAVPDCTAVAIPPSWPRGWENCWEYWMKACTSPRRSDPEATMAPPTTAMAT